jgi:peptidoglycan/LPS O-acetylase OafA/YrhL
MVSINSPVLSTWIIALFLVCFLIFSARPRKPGALFSPSVTKELKGAAILMVVFSHIGYFLANDPRFLWPLSIMAGVGVNLFLFLSGYGLSVSNMKTKLGIRQWYKKRLPKLFIPLWIIVGVLFLMDYSILNRHYSFQYIWHSMIGFFPRADVYKDLDSILWYFTLILFYYLLFPLTFSKKHLWISAILLLSAGELFIRWGSLVSPDVLKLYKIHYFAFPLGVLAAWVFSPITANKVRQYLNTHIDESTSKKSKSSIGDLLTHVRHYLLILTLMITIGYLSVHSSVGQNPHKEQFVSLCTMALIILLFIVKKVEFRLLSLFGVFSYAIYLFHWPLLSRYDVLYRHMPAWLATLAWLGIFIMLGWLLSVVSGNFMRNLKVKRRYSISFR